MKSEVRDKSVFASESPPSRAAWIEIDIIPKMLDRTVSRRLHGRRGLKCAVKVSELNHADVAAFTGGVD